jgi:hypothetical protein
LESIKKKEEAKPPLLREREGENRLVKINMGQIIAYKMVRVKLKIAYEAAIRKISIFELYIEAMIKAYNIIHSIPTENQINLLDEEENIQ